MYKQSKTYGLCPKLLFILLYFHSTFTLTVLWLPENPVVHLLLLSQSLSSFASLCSLDFMIHYYYLFLSKHYPLTILFLPVSYTLGKIQPSFKLRTCFAIPQGKKTDAPNRINEVNWLYLQMETYSA